jgi:hypothetical protein
MSHKDELDACWGPLLEMYWFGAITRIHGRRAGRQIYQVQARSYPIRFCHYAWDQRPYVRKLGTKA